MNQDELTRDGWIATSTSGGTHLERTMDMYKELGFEIHLEELNPEECQGCTECYSIGNETIYRIYTRVKDEI